MASRKLLPYKSMIIERFQGQNDSIDEIKEFLETEKRVFVRSVAFLMTRAMMLICDSKSAYERQLKIWGCQKNLPQDTWKFIRLQLKEREASGKKSQIYFRGNLLDETKFQRRMKRVFVTFQEESGLVGECEYACISVHTTNSNIFRASAYPRSFGHH